MKGKGPEISVHSRKKKNQYPPPQHMYTEPANNSWICGIRGCGI